MLDPQVMNMDYLAGVEIAWEGLTAGCGGGTDWWRWFKPESGLMAGGGRVADRFIA